MAINETVLVTGATGNQGKAVAKALIKQGYNVKALTRSKEKTLHLEKLGAEVVIGDLNDKDSLYHATKGIKKIFLVTTPFEAGMEKEIEQGLNMIDVAKEIEIEHLVFSSVSSATKNTGIPHFETKAKIEQYLFNADIPATIIRPVAFMDNMSIPNILSMIHENKISLPINKTARLQMVALDDLGEAVTNIFSNKELYLNKAIDIASDELTMSIITKLVSEKLNKPLIYEKMSSSISNKMFHQDFNLMFKWFNKEGFDVKISEVGKKFGIKPTSFKDLLA